MKIIPAFLSTLLLAAIRIKTTKLAKRVYKTVGTIRLAVTAWGNKTCPIPIESVESTMHDPIISPIAMECCFNRNALISTASSGSEVPIATPKKLMIYS